MPIASRQRNIPVSSDHQLSILVRGVTSIISLFFVFWGFTKHSVCSTILGMVWILRFKSLFNDRMVHPYEEIKDASPQYRSCLY